MQPHTPLNHVRSPPTAPAAPGQAEPQGLRTVPQIVNITLFNLGGFISNTLRLQRPRLPGPERPNTLTSHPAHLYPIVVYYQDGASTNTTVHQFHSPP